jgi:hypothetical protein
MQIRMTANRRDAVKRRRDRGDRKDLSTGLSLSFNAVAFARSRKSAILGDWHIGTITPSDEHQIELNIRCMEGWML